MWVGSSRSICGCRFSSGFGCIAKSENKCSLRLISHEIWVLLDDSSTSSWQDRLTPNGVERLEGDLAQQIDFELKPESHVITYPHIQLVANQSEVGLFDSNPGHANLTESFFQVYDSNPDLQTTSLLTH